MVGSGYTFYNGQNVYGRTLGFQMPASGNSRPLINDTFILLGNNRIANLTIQGNSIVHLETGGGMMTQPFQAGVFVTPLSFGNVSLENTNVNVSSDTNSIIGIANNSLAGNLLILNSNILTNRTGAVGAVNVGVGNLHQGEINILNSTVSVESSDIVNTFGVSFGVVNNEDGNVNIVNSFLNATTTRGGLTAAILNNSSIAVSGPGGNVAIAGSAINVTAVETNLVAGVFNQANNGFGDSGNVSVSQTTVAVSSLNNGGGSAFAIGTDGNGAVIVNQTAMTGVADSGNLAGLLVASPTSTMSYSNTLINILTSGTALGIPTQSGGTLIDNGGNQCFNNGVEVPC